MTVTETAPEAAPEIGASRRRKEDQRLITGRTRYTDNMTLPGMLHLALVRSPFAHAHHHGHQHRRGEGLAGCRGRHHRCRRRRRPGQPAERLAHHRGPEGAPAPADRRRPRRLRRRGRGRASSPARRPRLVTPSSSSTSTTTSCRVVLDLEEAAADEMLAHPDLGTNESATWIFDSGRGRHRRRRRGGHQRRATASSSSATIVQQRLIPAFMEPRSTVVDPTGEQMTMWSSTQVPHILRLMLAMVLGMPGVEDPGHRARRRGRIRRQAAGHAGGVHHDDGCPADRQAVQVHRDPQRVPDGRVTTAGPRSRSCASPPRRTAPSPALDVRILLADMGAYLGLVSSGVPILGAFMYNAIYKFPAYRFECTNVFTNKVWTDAYRGAGRPEATFAIERLMDELAVELDMDPLELRRKNWIEHDEFPFTTVAGLEYDSGNYEAATDKAVELFGYDELRAEQKRRRDAGERVQLGIGISTFTEMCGLAPSRVLGALSYGGRWLGARGHPGAAHRQGRGRHRRQRARPGARDGVEPDRRRSAGCALRGRRGPARRHPGVAEGARHLRVTLAHRRRHRARRTPRTRSSRRPRPMAAHLMEANRDDIEFANGQFTVKGTDQGMGLGELSLAVFTAQQHAGRVRAEPRLRRDLRSRQLLVPARHASRGHGGRHRDRRDHDP